jgi:hypothetical protein
VGKVLGNVLDPIKMVGVLGVLLENHECCFKRATDGLISLQQGRGVARVQTGQFIELLDVEGLDQRFQVRATCDSGGRRVVV